MNKECTDCKTIKTLKWYSGPTCRNCYRKSLRITHIKNGTLRPSVWAKNNKEYCRQMNKKWVIENYKYHLQYQKEYRVKNKLKKYDWEKRNRAENINRRIADNLRNRLNMAIKNNQKHGSAVRDLGCSVDQLKVHLEKQFEPGMTWYNWSRDGWHIDHKKPLSSFDLTDKEQFLEACSYINLQPLWAKDNLIKGSSNGKA